MDYKATVEALLITHHCCRVVTGMGAISATFPSLVDAGQFLWELRHTFPGSTAEPHGLTVLVPADWTTRVVHSTDG